MVERLVRVDQFLQLLDDLQLDFQVGFLLGVERRDELVAAAAVLLEQVFEPKFLRIGSRHELRFVAAGFDKSPALCLDLGAVRLVEGYLDGFHHPAQRLHRLLVEHLGEQGDHLLPRSGRRKAHPTLRPHLRPPLHRLPAPPRRTPRSARPMQPPRPRNRPPWPVRRPLPRQTLRPEQPSPALPPVRPPTGSSAGAAASTGGSAAVSPTAAATGSPTGSSAGTATVTSSAAGASEADVFCTSSALLTCSSGTEGLVILVAILR